MPISIGGSKSKSKTNNNHQGEGAHQDGNQGGFNYGNASKGGQIHVTTNATDHGAVNGALSVANNAIAGNVASTQSSLAAGIAFNRESNDLSKTALLSNNLSVRAALDSSGAMAKDAFNFGSKSLDLGSYAIESNAAFANAALGTVSNTTNSAMEKLAGFASEILANGERATRGALQFAKETNRSDSANQAELMIKAVSVLGIVAVLAFAFGGKK